MLKVWGRTTSANVQKVMWTIAELRLPHERIDAGGAFGRLDTPEYTALNPNKLIPTIQDGDLTLWESSAIIRYLARTYGAGQLQPVAGHEIAHADQWMEWTSTTLYPDIIGSMFMGLIRTPAAQRNTAAIATSIQRVGEKLAILDDALANRPYILGDRLTMADIPAGGLMYRYFTLPVARPRLANLEAWFGRLQERAAYQDHVMIDYSALRVEGA
ncbi:MAG: glutathione S-transferase [Hyphomicrobium sp.]